MSKVCFTGIDLKDGACYEFKNDMNNLLFLYIDGRYGNVDGLNPGFWEKFYCANVIDVDYRVIDGENVVIKVNHIR